ncbi:MAG: M6 family metalloprotease domain-containing protein [Candidatus Saccharibacteria bacterium]
MSIRKGFTRLTAALTLVLFAISLLPTAVLAVPAMEGFASFKQPNGTSFMARQRGDERINWVEDTLGQVIQHDHDGFWYYARTGGLKGVISNLKVAIDNSPSDVMRSSSIMKNLSSGLFNTESSTLQSPTFSAQSRPTDKVLVLLVEFDDQPLTYSDEAWVNYFFGTSGKTVRSYYREVSYNKFDLLPAEESQGNANDGIVKVHINYNHPNKDADPNIVKNALTAADSFVDFGLYDTDGNGSISPWELHVLTVVGGYDRAYSNTWSPCVWAHRGAFSSGAPVLDNVSVCSSSSYGGYIQIGEKHGEHQATIGTACHELGHDLGLPDLYNTGGLGSTGTGIGPHCLMSSGSWGGMIPGETPVHLSAWAKVDQGFINPATVQLGSADLTAATSSGYQPVKVSTSNPDQYFLIENRQFTSFDQGLASFFESTAQGGIIIYHVDEAVIRAKRSNNTINNDAAHKGIDVEEAGGQNLDSKPYTPYGPHYFTSSGNNHFEYTTSPNSLLYNGQESGADISINSDYSNTMNISVSNGPVNIPVSQVILDKHSLTFEPGGSAQTLTAAVVPDNATNKSVFWSSSDENVVKVANGAVSPVSAGTATIKVTTADGGFTDTCQVTVLSNNIAVSGVRLDRQLLQFTVGDAAVQLNATISPSNASNKMVTWSSSNPSVASVINGVVTPGAAGTATITVKTVDGGYTASCPVTVFAKPAVTLKASPTSPQKIFTKITLSASSVGVVNPQYKISRKTAFGTWSTIKDWSTGSTATWTPLLPGTYVLKVEVRAAGATVVLCEQQITFIIK